MCVLEYVCVCARTYLLFKTDVQPKNKLLAFTMGLVWLDANESFTCSAVSSTEAIACFDNISFRFCRTIIGFMYVSCSSYLTVSQICHFTCFILYE